MQIDLVANGNLRCIVERSLNVSIISLSCYIDGIDTSLKVEQLSLAFLLSTIDNNAF